MDVISNLHNWNCGIPIQLEDDIAEKLSIAEPSGLVTPNALSISANT